MIEALFHFFVGAVVITALWALVSWYLARLLRLDSPGGRSLIFFAPLLAGFLARPQLLADQAGLVLMACLIAAVALATLDVARYFRFRRRLREHVVRSGRLQHTINEVATLLGIAPPRAFMSDSPAHGRSSWGSYVRRSWCPRA